MTPLDHEAPFECIDPDLGNELWRLDVPDGDAAMGARLRFHLEHCDACRLRRRLLAELPAALATGSAAERSRARLGGPWWALASSGAMAAGLALLLLLPPRPADHGEVLRATGPEPVIARPVLGEVLRDPTPAIRWRPVPGATSYRVTVLGVGTDFRWETETTATGTELPPEHPLAARGAYRIFLETVPRHLAPAGGYDSAFRLGGVAELVGHRLRDGALPGRVALLGGLAGLLGWAAARWAGHRKKLLT